MLSAKGICKSFGELDILKDIELEVAAGEVVSIVGSSGAGKTTLLQILGTLDQPDKGLVEIDGEVLNQLNDQKLAKFRNQNIGFVFQFHQLLPEFTAIENVMLPAMIGGLGKTNAMESAKKLLDTLGLSERVNHQPGELSGGEQQRVAVARALINQPKIIFADEPSGNLDSSNSQSLHELFFEIRDQFNPAFVIVTHNSTLADMADRKLEMKDGRFV